MYIYLIDIDFCRCSTVFSDIVILFLFVCHRVSNKKQETEARNNMDSTI